MAYTAAQYAAQDRIMAQVRSSNLTGRCPVCNLRPCGAWPDGVRRITCGDARCYEHWLNIRPASPPHKGADSLDTPSAALGSTPPDGFTVSLVTD